MKKFCVITHTHWDREWYQPFEEFRLRLVDLMDRLLIILENYPEYIFHLDAQTIVLEDYLEIRPSKRELLRKHITEGRIIVGPWYLQNDFYLTSGEATIRNLLVGTKIAREFGKCSNIGYAPDQFGNISQLPQILRNFGIDNFLFSRGYNEYDGNKENYRRKPSATEFIWQGADQTQVLAIHLKYCYNNAQRFSKDISLSMKLVEEIEESFEGVAVTPYLLLMNGVDHLEAQGDLLPILEEIGKRLDEEKVISQYNMADYLASIKKYIKDNDISLYVYDKELRNGEDDEILLGTLTSRHYLKVLNVKAQNLLECKLEPMFSMLECFGALNAYSLDHFTYLWKQLMKNHTHDCICGCSRDEVHDNMEQSYQKLNEVFNVLYQKGLEIASHHLDVKEDNLENYILIAQNTTENNYDGILEGELCFPSSEKVENFDIYDFEGNKIDFLIKNKVTKRKDFFTPINLPSNLEVDIFDIYFEPGLVKGFSVKGFIVKPAREIKRSINLMEENSTVFDNGLLKVIISENGQVDITDRTGRVIKNAIEVEDTIDRGSSYVYVNFGDYRVMSSDFTPEINLLENNKYVQKAEIIYNFLIPEDYDFAQNKPFENKALCKVKLTLALKKECDYLEIDYEIDNKVKHHQLRIIVDTGIVSDESIGDIPFDVITHTIGEGCPKSYSYSKAFTSFAAIEKNGIGTAVFAEGCHDYKHYENEKSKLGFAILRSTLEIHREKNLEKAGGELWTVPGNLCLRKMNGRLAIRPYTGDHISANIPAVAKQFRNLPMTYSSSMDSKKFFIGRPAVQDSALNEIHYLEDPYFNLRIPNDTPVLSVKGEGVSVTAYKKAEDEDGYILRFVNLSKKMTNATIVFDGKMFKTLMNEEESELLGNNEITIKLGAKEIYSLRLKN